MMNEDDRKLIETIAGLMKTRKNDEGSIVLEITPQVALHILQNWRGTHNRDEKPASIKRFASDMADPGGWMLNGSTIVFTDQHLLGDGQNRLLACTRCLKPFQTHVVFGVPQAFFFSIDQGRPRSPADLLKVAGVANAEPVAQAVRWAELLETKRAIHRTVFNAPQILKLYRERHDGVADFIDEARKIRRLYRQPLGLVMGLLYSFNKIDPQQASDFGDAWGAGSYEPRFAPIATMQTELMRIKNQTNGRVHEVVRAAMIINSWNAVRAGNKGRPSIINWSMPTKDKPSTFPTIK